MKCKKMLKNNRNDEKMRTAALHLEVSYSSTCWWQVELCLSKHDWNEQISQSCVVWYEYYQQVTYEYSVWMNMLCVKTWRPSSTTATIHPSLIIKMLWRLIKENKSISITTYCNTNQISDHVIHFHQQRKSNIWAKNCQIQTWKIARLNPFTARDRRRPYDMFL